MIKKVGTVKNSESSIFSLAYYLCVKVDFSNRECAKERKE
jgi:hypothetical protein